MQKNPVSPDSRRPRFRPRIFEFFGSQRAEFSLAGEVSAGVTVGLIALPLALALGIASVPSGVNTPIPAPAMGIITAIVGGFLISFLGGSRVQIGGPTAAFIPIILLVVREHGYGGLLMATMMAGGILILMGIARMGSLVKFIPWPVTSGFTTGIAVAIMLTQVPDFAGYHVTGEPMPGEFVEKILWIFHHIGSINWYSFGLAGICVALILLWPKLNLKRIPGSIAVMLVATLWVTFTDWESLHGVATIGSKFGPDAIPNGLPRPMFPAFEWTTIRELIGPATAIAILGSIESLLSAVVADGLSGDRHDSNTELIAQGCANLICPLFGGLPTTGAIARTSANVNNGGKTPLAGMVHALSLLVVILLVAKWAAYIPMAAMSAILVVIGLRIGEWHELRRIPKLPVCDGMVLLTTFSLTVVFDLVIAIEIGMVLAAILFIKRVSQTTEVSLVTRDDMLERPEHLAQGKELPAGVMAFRIFGPFMFGAVEKMEDALLRIGHWPTVIILRLHLVTGMDATGMNALESVVERMNKHGGTIIVSGIHQQPLQMLRKAGFIDAIGVENFCATFDDAIARSKEILDHKESAGIR